MERLLQLRRENLRRVVTDLGGPTTVAKLLGHSNGTFLAQLIGPKPIRDISEKVARSIESTLALGAGIIDTESGTRAQQGTTNTLGDAIIMLVQELGNDRVAVMREEKFGQLCALVLTQHREAGLVSPKFLIQVLRLAGERDA